MRQIALLASDSSHLPLLTVFKESGVTQKYGFEIELDVVGGAKAPTMAHRTSLIFAGEIDFVSGLHHETYRMAGDRRTYVDRVVAGEASAALVDMPFDLYGKNSGLKIIDLPDRPVIHNTTILTTTDYIREHRENVIQFLKALIETIHFFKTQPDRVASILQRNLAKRYGLTEENYYHHLQTEWAKLLLVKPYPLPAAIQNVYELDVAKDPKMASVGPLEPWDLHYLREIDDSGFIDALYSC